MKLLMLKNVKTEHKISSLIFDIVHFILNVINYNFLTN